MSCPRSALSSGAPHHRGRGPHGEAKARPARSSANSDSGAPGPLGGGAATALREQPAADLASGHETTLGFLDANPAAEALYGYSRAELRSRTIADDLPPDERRQLLDKRASLPSGPSHGTWTIRRKDGTERAIEVITQELKGRPPRRLVVGRDITEEKATAQALRDSLHRYERLQEAGIVGILTADMQGHIREANQAFLDMVGYTRADLEAGKVRWDTLTAPEFTPQNARFVDTLSRESKAPPMEKEYIRKNGTRVPALIASVALDATEHLTLVVDLSERRAAEEALRRSEHLFRAIVETSPIGITLMKEDTTVIYISPSSARIAQFTPQELTGKKLCDLPFVVDREGYLREWAKCLAQPGVLLREQLIGRRKDGLPRVIESTRLNLLGDPNLRAVLTFQIDLTDQRALEDQLRQAQKMEAIGNLAGGVAHDFNNLLTVILGYSDELLAQFEPEHPARADTQEIKNAGERAAALTRQLLAFSRQQVLDPRVIDLQEPVAEAEKLIRRLIGENISLATHVEYALEMVKVDPAQVAQVLMNLAVNARDAMPRGGALTIDLANAQVSASEASKTPGVMPGRFVRLSVEDTGVGMSTEVLARIFEPFFTTKKESGGTGLGLSTVFGIVRQSGGFLTVDSAPGKGSRFRIYLPMTHELPAPARPTRAGVVPGGTETLLIAEDEEQVRALIREILSRKGYTVLAARSAEEALIAAEQHDGSIDLLLTDLVMARMTGRELAEQLVTQRPGISVLYMSGYTQDGEIQRLVSEGRAPFVPKPITPDVLLRRVRELLDARPSARN